jgi:hypothetical protein
MHILMTVPGVSFSLIFMQDLGSNLIEYRAISLKNNDNQV